MKRFPVKIKPVSEIDPALIDPDYQNRVEASRRSNSTVYKVGSLATARQRKEFSDQHLLRSAESFGLSSARDDFVIRIDSHNGRVTNYRIPNKWRQFARTIAKIAEHEHSAYPNAKHNIAMASVHQSFVEAGTAQRSGWHPDALSGEWKHVYLVADTMPTEFRADHIANPYEITYMNGLVEHQSPAMEVEAVRTFLRVIYHHNLSVLQAA